MADVERPWTLKGVTEEERSMATSAAKRANMPIGRYVIEAVRAKIVADTQGSKALVPYVAISAEERATEAANVVALVKDMKEALGEPPESMKKAAWSVVQDRIRDLKRGQVPARSTKGSADKASA